ncbi:ParB/RepB/Spo0J family partition protein [uncultured Micrococcus sp.]|uniref:ParB/RepB/Spo0J family partition protein n=1 Tax=uncultured Micrococcus sp. TaxID=114051 RepID=UPI0025D29844|nr:ParB/RepB/Spo0J family partition protein [uncultured Micrococcus sp.]
MNTLNKEETVVKTSRRGGLGRGLGALIQNTTEPDGAGASSTDTPIAAEDSASDTKVPTSERRPRGASEKAGGTPRPSVAEVSPDRKPSSKNSNAEAPDAAPGRPADIFFTRTEDPDAERTRRPSRSGSGRPSMPTVKAPGRRTAATSSPDTGDAAAPKPVDGTVSPDIAVLRDIPVGDIHPNPRQPREVFDEEHMAELVTSITEVGILQPIIVRQVSDADTPYELIMGERRWRATQKAGLETIPAIIRQTPDQDLLRDALLENLHRSQLNPLEEAAAYQQLLEDFSCTQEELSQRIGRSRPQISNTMRLLRLPPLVQRRVAAGTLSAGHARALLGLEDPAEMERLAQRIVSEGLSVRATEDAVAQLQGSVRPAPKATRGREDGTRHERLDYFATALTSRLDTQVKITLGARKGRIAIDFTSVEDLNRIMDLIQGEAPAGKDLER